MFWLYLTSLIVFGVSSLGFIAYTILNGPARTKINVYTTIASTVLAGWGILLVATEPETLFPSAVTATVAVFVLGLQYMTILAHNQPAPSVAFAGVIMIPVGFLLLTVAPTRAELVFAIVVAGVTLLVASALPAVWTKKHSMSSFLVVAPFFLGSLAVALGFWFKTEDYNNLMTMIFVLAGLLIAQAGTGLIAGFCADHMHYQKYSWFDYKMNMYDPAVTRAYNGNAKLYAQDAMKSDYYYAY
jgi:hypothetical protein